MADSKVAEFKARLVKTASPAATPYRIPITIVNNSSVGFQKAEVAVKDEGTQTVDTVYFGHIPSRTSATEHADLPGGVEQCIWKILPDVGDEIYGYGLGNNAPGVRLTITD